MTADIPRYAAVSPRTATLALFATCVCWAVSLPVVRALMLDQAAAVPEASTWCISAWGLGLRFAIAALFLGWWCRAELARPTRAEWTQGVGLGLFTGLGMLLQMDALGYASASTVCFLNQGYVIWIPLLAAARSRRLPNARVIACVITVVIGVGILARVDLRSMRLGRGEFEAILCSLVFAAQILWAERPGYAANRVGLIAVLTFAVAAVAFMPVVALTAPSVGALVALYADPWHVAFLIGLAIGSTGLGMLMMFRYQRYVGATAAAIIYCSEPIFVAGFAFFMPAMLSALLAVNYANETLTRELVIGGGLIIAANVVMQIWAPSGKTDSAPRP